MLTRKLILAAALMISAGAWLHAQGREVEFRGLAQQIVAQRQAGGEEKAELLERALAIVDEVTIGGLNAVVPTAGPSRLPYMNVVIERMQALSAPEIRIGESYVAGLVGAESSPAGVPVYAGVVNFGLSGPSAVRLYAPVAVETVSGHERWTNYKLVGRIDRISHSDYFDEYLEVVAVNPGAAVFVTVTGRTDDRKTGIFMAWRYHGGQVHNVWTSDLLEHSTYEAKDGEFRVTYCSEADDDRPSVCKAKQTDRYHWAGAWTRRTADDTSPKTTAAQAN